MYRIHFDTGAGALCGTRNVLGWTTKVSVVTCPACRARLPESAPADRRTPQAPGSATEGSLAPSSR